MSNAENVVVRKLPYLVSLGAFGVLSLTNGPALAAPNQVLETCAFNALELGFDSMPSTTQDADGTKTIKNGTCDEETGTCQIISISFPAGHDAAVFKAAEGVAIDATAPAAEGVTASVVIPFNRKALMAGTSTSAEVAPGPNATETQTVKSSLVDTVKTFGDCVMGQKSHADQRPLYSARGASLAPVEAAFNKAVKTQNPVSPTYRLKLAEGPTNR